LLRILRTFCTFASSNDNDMTGGTFEVAYMDDAVEFLDGLSPKIREKIYYNISKVSGGIRDISLFKKLDGANDLWEFRTRYDGMQYRLFAFWDKSSKRLVIATHGIVKKSWKIPVKEIARAELLRDLYYQSK